MPLAVRESEGAVTFEVQVVPRASRDRLGPIHGDKLKVQLTAAPVDGAANEALIALVAKRLGVDVTPMTPKAIFAEMKATVPEFANTSFGRDVLPIQLRFAASRG
jgi:hypothetical protein